MSEPGLGTGQRAHALAARFTARQFLVFAIVGGAVLAALSYAGLSFGLALAGAATAATLTLAAWFIVVNLFDGETPPRHHRRS